MTLFLEPPSRDLNQEAYAVFLTKTLFWVIENILYELMMLVQATLHIGLHLDISLSFCLDLCNQCITINCMRPCLAHTDELYSICLMTTSYFPFFKSQILNHPPRQILSVLKLMYLPTEIASHIWYTSFIVGITHKYNFHYVLVWRVKIEWKFYPIKFLVFLCHGGMYLFVPAQMMEILYQ